MLKEKSCGAVLFRKEKGRILYLLLHYEAGHWDFPKGNQEKGEEEIETVKREIVEETGIAHINLLDGFKQAINYKYKNTEKLLVDKNVSFYLAEAGTPSVKISLEHIGYAWLYYEDALERITYKNSRELLEKAEHFLRHK